MGRKLNFPIRCAQVVLYWAKTAHPLCAQVVVHWRKVNFPTRCAQVVLYWAKTARLPRAQVVLYSTKTSFSYPLRPGRDVLGENCTSVSRPGRHVLGENFNLKSSVWRAGHVPNGLFQALCGLLGAAPSLLALARASV